MTAHDEVMSVNCSPCWTLGQPLEVNAIQMKPETEPKTEPTIEIETDTDAAKASASLKQTHAAAEIDSAMNAAGAAARPSNAAMMASLRALQQQRRTMDEAAAAIEQVVRSLAPDSLVADLARAEPT